MKRTQWFKLVAISGLICLLPVISAARGERGERPPRGAPPEAIEACEGRSSGDSVEFTGRRGETLEATCEEKDGQLVAVPDHPPEHRGRR